MCLIETTTAGIDHPTQNRANTATRANVMTSFGTAHFATIGYRGTSAASVATIASAPWFHDADTKADGVLVSPIRWSWFQPWGKFYGVYPRPAEYSGITLSTNSYTSTPYADITVMSEKVCKILLVLSLKLGFPKQEGNL